MLSVMMLYPTHIETILNPLEKNVAKLFHDMGFQFVASDYVVLQQRERLGEIDLLFTFDKFLFLIEVSADKGDRSRKKITFFSKWAKDEFINPVRVAFGLSNKKIVKIYFDFSKNSFKDESDNVSNFLKDQKLDVIAYNDDYNYFVNSTKKIGKWARNDLLDWAGVVDRRTTEETDAIQYYLQDYPVYCFVQRVDTLLNSCYVSRRRRNSPDPGYQRTLNEKRIANIQHNIESQEGLAFPNSILIYSPKLADTVYPKEECPHKITIRFPTSFCSCRIIDGQHRLLGFSKLEPKKLESHFLTIIALPEIDEEKEFRTFIEINSKQQKMDNNLILHLKSDFNWPEGTKERKEQIGVRVAERLNEGILKNRIYFGTSDESKGNKITLVTFVPSLRNNKQILDSEDETFKKISGIFALVGEYMPEQLQPNGFFNQNQGIRVLFRLIQLFERNRQRGKIAVKLKNFFADLSTVLDETTTQELFEYYGGGGATAATRYIIRLMKEIHPENYERMQGDLVGI